MDPEWNRRGASTRRPRLPAGSDSAGETSWRRIATNLDRPGHVRLRVYHDVRQLGKLATESLLDSMGETVRLLERQSRIEHHYHVQEDGIRETASPHVAAGPCRGIGEHGGLDGPRFNPPAIGDDIQARYEDPVARDDDHPGDRDGGERIGPPGSRG